MSRQIVAAQLPWSFRRFSGSKELRRRNLNLTRRRLEPVRKLVLAVFKFLCSLKLAVLVIVGLAVSLAVATVLESLYDTPTGQYHVYRSKWFYGLLFGLGLN